MSYALDRLIHSLVKAELVPQDQLVYGTEFVARQIRAAFDPIARKEALNPDRVVGKILAERLEKGELLQKELARLVNIRYRSIGIPEKNSFFVTKAVLGYHALDYKEGLAIAHALEIPPEALSPWGFLQFTDEPLCNVSLTAEGYDADRFIRERIRDAMDRRTQRLQSFYSIEQLIRDCNELLGLINADPLTPKKPFSRRYVLGFISGLAIAYVLEVPPEAFSPWDWHADFQRFRGDSGNLPKEAYG